MDRGSTGGDCTHDPIEAFRRLLHYCRQRNWAGFDPYDALNSRVLAATPLQHSRHARIALTQALKRLPFNLRPLLGVPEEQNAKGIALFLMAFLKVPRNILPDRDELVTAMVERLTALRSAGTGYWCWGYSFPWQTRTVLVPRGAPNLVCTAFVADALLDLYEQDRQSVHLEMALSAADYVVEQLYWTGDDGSVGFSYPVPGLRPRVHNANFLGAALLCRAYALTGRSKFLETALNAARHSARCQEADGSWRYGDLQTQSWIDNFHTGFNLCALDAIGRNGRTQEFRPHLEQGYDFYLHHFFTEAGVPKYFHNSTYPIDAHCIAQSLITLDALSDLSSESRPRATAVFDWAMANMWDQRGFFYYRRLRFLTNRISYMRWTQAWMLLALATTIGRPNACPAARAT
jgi:hypothetical protein